MSTWGKSIRIFVIAILVAFATFVVSNFFLIMKINMNENTVCKAYFIDCYFVEADTEEVKIQNFKDFMLSDGWRFSENYYGKIIFRKGNLQKEVELEKLILISNI